MFSHLISYLEEETLLVTGETLPEKLGCHRGRLLQKLTRKNKRFSCCKSRGHPARSPVSARSSHAGLQQLNFHALLLAANTAYKPQPAKEKGLSSKPPCNAHDPCFRLTLLLVRTTTPGLLQTSATPYCSQARVAT